MRHGQTTTNVKNLVSNKINRGSHLTEKGIEETKKSAENLKNENIDLIISLLHLIELVKLQRLVMAELGLNDDQVIV